MNKERYVFYKLIFFEFLLAAVALFVLVWKQQLCELLCPDNWHNFLWSFVFVWPMLVLFWFFVFYRNKLKWIQDIEFYLKSVLSKPLIETNRLVILLAGFAAGFSEELLFRGVIQESFGIWITSIVFGLLHAKTKAYFVVATFISIYLGLIYQKLDNIWVVIAIHASYDSIVLLYYQREAKN